MTTTIDIPMPPSTNRIWRSRRGHNGKACVYMSPRYATWKRAADNMLMAQKRNAQPVKGEFAVSITLDRKKLRKGADPDNRIKAALDFLQRSGLVENDSLLVRQSLEFGYAPEGCRIVLWSMGTGASA